MSLQEGDWLYNKVANRHVQTYVKGFVDVSGGDVILRNGNLNVAGRSDLSGDTVMHQNANVRGLIKQSDSIIEGGFIYREVVDPAIQESIDEVNAIRDSLSNFILVNVIDPSLIYIGGVTNTINILGDASMDNTLSVGGAVNMDNTLLVQGDVSMNSDLSVDGAVNMDNTLLVQGDVSMNSDFLVDGAVNMDSTLFVQGDVSLNSKLFVADDVSFNTGLKVGGDVSMNSDLSVDGAVNMDSTLLVQGDVSMNNILSVGGDVSMNSDFSVDGAVNMDSTLLVQGDVSMNSTLLVQGDVSMNSDLSVDGAVSMDSTLLVQGDVSMNSGLSVDGTVDINNGLIVNEDVSMNNGLTVNEDVSMNSKLFVVGDVSLNNELFVGGDVSMNSDVFVGGDVSINGVINVMTVNSYDGALTIIGDVSMNNGLTVNDDVSMNSKLFVVGDVSLNNELFVGGDVSMNNDAFVGGDISVNGVINVMTVNSYDGAVIDGSLNCVDIVANRISAAYVDADNLIFQATDISVNSTRTNELAVGGIPSPETPFHVTGRRDISNVNTSELSNCIAKFNDINGIAGVVLGCIDDNSPYISDCNGSATNSTGLRFLTQSQTRMMINSNGNVGIGTTDPLQPLHLNNSSGDTYLHMTCRDSGTTVNDGFSLAQGADKHIYFNQRESAEMVFQTNNTERMRITSSGNVGIGTYTPQQKLHVNGHIYLGDNDGDLQVIHCGGNIGLSSDTNVYIVSDSNDTSGEADGGDIIFGSGSNVDMNNPYFSTPTSYPRNEHMRIAGNSRVGIGGIASPTETLDVNGNINFQDYLKTHGYSIIKNTASGTPDIYADVRVIRNSIKSDGMYIGYGNSGTTSGHLRFYANNTNERMRISASNGYVGIGTTSPGVPLHVHTGGNFTASSVRYFRYNDGGLVWGDFNNVTTSVYGKYSIGTNTHIFAHSDGRIKKDIIEINDDSSLQKIRLLKPSYYRYKDYIDKQESRIVEGFIAQEVEDVVPSAVKLTRGELPNIMLRGTIVDDNAGNKIITIPNYNTNQLELDASGNIFTKLIIYIDDDDDSHEDVAKEVNIIEIISSTEIRVNTNEELPEEIFVYGQEVNNKRALIKDKIFTIGISALQEVDRQLQAEKAKTITLETKVSTLEAQLNNVLTRLSALENTN